jgi:hypothetical protein
MNAEQRLVREDASQATAEEGVDGADTERAERQPVDALRRECSLDLRPLRTFRGAPGQQQDNPACPEAAHRERERVRRGSVKPLQVIDCDYLRSLLRKQLERISDGDSERTRIHGARRVVNEKKCALERTAPRRRQPADHLVEHTFEQVSKASVSEATLGLSRSRQKGSVAERAPVLDTRQPNRRFPNPGFTLEHQRHRSAKSAVEETVNRTNFCVAPNDLETAHRKDLGSASCGRKRDVSRIRP